MISRKLALLMMASALISPGTLFAQSRGCEPSDMDIEQSFDARLNANVRSSIVQNAAIGLVVGAAAALTFPAAVGVGGAMVIAAGFTLLGGMLPAVFRTAGNEVFNSFDNSIDLLISER